MDSYCLLTIKSYFFQVTLIHGFHLFLFFKCQKMLKMKEMPYYNLQQNFPQGKVRLLTV